MDYLAAVAAYPKPDDKIRTTSLQVQFYYFFSQIQHHEILNAIISFILSLKFYYRYYQIIDRDIILLFC